MNELDKIIVSFIKDDKFFFEPSWYEKGNRIKLSNQLFVCRQWFNVYLHNINGNVKKVIETKVSWEARWHQGKDNTFCTAKIGRRVSRKLSKLRSSYLSQLKNNDQRDAVAKLKGWAKVEGGYIIPPKGGIQ